MSLSALVLWLALGTGVRASDEVEFFELVAEGPLEAVLIADGERAGASATRVDGPLGARERRTLLVPVVRGATLAGEERAALPEARLLGAGAGASARVVGPAEPPPARALERLPPGLRGRPWPVPPARSPRPAWSALAALVLVLCLSLSVRHRPALFAALALGGALAVFLAAGPARALPPEERVLEAELGSALCLEVRAARDELALGFDQLTLEPPSAALAIRCSFEGQGSARARGALLVARRVLAVPGELAPARNGWGELASAWVRDRGGRWSFHGPWAHGSALPAERPDPGLPAWLAAGVPPGTGILIGRLGGPDGGWVRAVGFDAP